MDNYKLDMNEFVKQLKEQATIELISALAPDKETGELSRKLLTAFLNNGVPVETALKVMKDLCDIDEFKK